MILFLCLITVNKAHAVIKIDITQGNINPLPIALPKMSGNSDEAKMLAKRISKLIENNLESTNLFKSISHRAFIQKIEGSSTVPLFPSWKKINASALFTGSLYYTENTEKFDTEYRLWDIFSEQQLLGKAFSTHHSNWRRIAHIVSDDIYSRLTGEKGFFDTRIVYVAETGDPLNRIKRLAVMDQDGANHRFLTDGSYLVLTPRFSPKTDEVIYLSYQSGIPKVYRRHIDTGQTSLIGKFPGMTFAPRFAPDGKSVVLSASNDGNSEIYTMNLANKRVKRLTKNSAIDTSPSFSPDGKRIVFNSDRGGSQQLYVMNKNGKGVKRISFGKGGRYATPVWSPRGDLIAFTKMANGKFYIGVMRPDGSGERLLTESFMDEGPTWSPNGRVIMFARQSPSYLRRAGKWSIHSIDLTGYNEKLIKTPYEASDPAWSALLR
jgi:TolB protein